MRETDFPGLHRLHNFGVPRQRCGLLPNYFLHWLLLLACRMCQYCFAYWRLSSSSVVVCNAAWRVGGRPPPGRPPDVLPDARATLNGGPVRVRPVMTTFCCYYYSQCRTIWRHKVSKCPVRQRALVLGAADRQLMT